VRIVEDAVGAAEIAAAGEAARHDDAAQPGGARRGRPRSESSTTMQRSGASPRSSAAR
jgi:hypothetical protein